MSILSLTLATNFALCYNEDTNGGIGGEDVSTYHNHTKKMIDLLKNYKPEFDEEKAEKRLKLKLGDFKEILPNKEDLASNALGVNLNAPSEKKRLAARVHKHHTLVHKVLSLEHPNMASRDLILCAVLLRDQIPCADDVSHILTTMQREDIYLDTCDKSVNCRNLLLKLCFDYASAANPCPCADWVVFTNSVICWFRQKAGLRLNIDDMKPLLDENPDFSFVQPMAALLRDWEAQLEKVGYCKLMTYRNQLIKEYIGKNRAKNKSAVQNSMTESLGYDESYFRKLFGAAATRRGSREALVEAAILLGCDLQQTNLLLRQACMPVLYPNSSLDNGMDAQYIHDILKERPTE